ncbi:DUF637 domain-containing protein [Xenophilus arseniciresistens]|uniref:DUF637 domain-containing protein n=1 Tax=Xenophilus arseniciresistens TaxID=1283306 RepID=A0AAE3NDF1_9BURK|nr:DUF637 domain-containing protein [Xenophilus arseniciresistens]MDA7418212.1 DUF637 domain-containing protein [Xenophilus arseniciresistens]
MRVPITSSWTITLASFFGEEKFETKRIGETAESLASSADGRANSGCLNTLEPKASGRAGNHLGQLFVPRPRPCVGPRAEVGGAAAGEAVAVGAGEGVYLSGGGTFLSSTGASISAVAGGALEAGIAALASQAAVAAVNNQFDLGATLETLGPSANVRQLLTAVVIRLERDERGISLGGVAADPPLSE